MATDSLPLLKGTLDLLVLKTLTWGEMHGFAISSWLDERSGGTVGVDDSALYQALHRLEGRGYVAAEWGITENNRRARFYTLTTAGRRHLRAETASWLKYTTTVTALLAVSGRSG